MSERLVLRDGQCLEHGLHVPVALLHVDVFESLYACLELGVSGRIVLAGDGVQFALPGIHFQIEGIHVGIGILHSFFQFLKLRQRGCIALFLCLANVCFQLFYLLLVILLESCNLTLDGSYLRIESLCLLLDFLVSESFHAGNHLIHVGVPLLYLSLDGCPFFCLGFTECRIDLRVQCSQSCLDQLSQLYIGLLQGGDILI